MHIFTPTDQVAGDEATYDLDQAVLVMTGHNLKLTTPTDVLTARDDLEYWSQRHMAVARGDAVVVTNDGRRIQADTLVAYTTDTPPHARPPSGRTGTGRPGDAGGGEAGAAAPAPRIRSALPASCEKVEAFGHVVGAHRHRHRHRRPGVYVPDTGIARLAGNVRITRGAEPAQRRRGGGEHEDRASPACSPATAGRVQGLVVPNDGPTSLAKPRRHPATARAAGPAGGSTGAGEIRQRA